MTTTDILEVRIGADRACELAAVVEFEGALVICGDQALLVVLPWTDTAQLRRWAAGRVERFRAGGPDVDGGWAVARDGSYQTWARAVSVPEVH